MAKKSAVERNLKRIRLVKNYAAKRARLKAVIRDKSVSAEERFKVTLQLAKLPRNSSKVRVRNRCLITGRSRGVYRKLKMSRIALREFGSSGLIPGMVKSSW